MIILSCFDGMSCGQIALERAGIPVKKYYASEIDKYAITVTQANYPDTMQLGSITEWRSWNIEHPDIIIGGSPCQGFSFAGKQLNFEDDRSKLFFTFVDVLKYYKPKYFLLENVIMKKEYNDVISSMLGELYPECVQQTELFRTGRLEPIKINSTLVSAQNRNRLYWTNIQGVEQPEDKEILLKDIIENATADRKKSYCLDANYFKGASKESSDLKGRRQLVLSARNGKPIIIPENSETPFMLTETRSEHGKETRRKIKQETGKDSTKRDIDSKIYKPNNNGKANCILTSNADELSTVFISNKSRCIQVGEADIKGNDQIKRVYSTEGKSPCISTCQGGNREPKIAVKGFENFNSENSIKKIKNNIRNINEKANCLTSSNTNNPAGCGCTNISTDNLTWRKLTPIECERLQTVPDNYTNYVSTSQRYKMLGNGWTVDVIVHIFSYIPM